MLFKDEIATSKTPRNDFLKNAQQSLRTPRQKIYLDNLNGGEAISSCNCIINFSTNGELITPATHCPGEQGPAAREGGSPLQSKFDIAVRSIAAHTFTLKKIFHLFIPHPIPDLYNRLYSWIRFFSDTIELSHYRTTLLPYREAGASIPQFPFNPLY
jgi:hypothetical protein